MLKRLVGKAVFAGTIVLALAAALVAVAVVYSLPAGSIAAAAVLASLAACVAANEYAKHGAWIRKTYETGEAEEDACCCGVPPIPPIRRRTDN